MKKSLFMNLSCFPVIVFAIISSLFAFHNTKLYAQDTSLTICSFNIQFLGHFLKRDNAALAMILRDFDIVVIQELVAAPFDGKFPDNTDFKPDKEAAEFFNIMSALGFKYRLSVEDTGTVPANHTNSTATEWWVVFYKADKVEIADELPTEFLADDRTKHEHYERVPHAFAFRTSDDKLDFVLISVHLKPGSAGTDKERRKEELTTIAEWVNGQDNEERDFIILGDMNLEDFDELQDAIPTGFRSLNDECEATNTNVNGPKPYDHVMYRPAFTNEIDKKFDFRVFNLIEALRPFWNSTDSYPGGSVNPIGLPKYDHNRFRVFYSDHHPVVFKMTIPATDDD